MEKITSNYFLEAEGLILGYHKAAPISQQPIYFKIPHQSVTALVGLNGSGKTTLIKSLIGESVLIDGSLKCFSHSIQSLSERDLSQLIAFVPQEPVYPSNLKVKHFLELAFLPQ
ncbi:MAG: ATP-binding cassette domain-containing protein, partial [Deltaproteobacteria bacterium]